MYRSSRLAKQAAANAEAAATLSAFAYAGLGGCVAGAFVAIVGQAYDTATVLGYAAAAFAAFGTVAALLMGHYRRKAKRHSRATRWPGITRAW